MTTRIFPQPLTSVAVLLIWLLLQNSLAPGILVLGIGLAIAIPMLTHPFWPEYPKSVRYIPLVRLVGVVIFDIVVANLTVAWLILGPKSRLRPGFVEIPLTLRGPYAITLLASIISLTPGTVSSNLSGDRRTLLVHALDIADAAETVARIKARYEAPLVEVFE
jgi:multicomponent K+:H+ antiporter subunit E